MTGHYVTDRIAASLENNNANDSYTVDPIMEDTVGRSKKQLPLSPLPQKSFNNKLAGVGDGLRKPPSSKMLGLQQNSSAKRRSSRLLTPLGSNKLLNQLIDPNSKYQLGLKSPERIFNNDILSVVNKFSGNTQSQKQVTNILHKVEESIAT